MTRGAPVTSASLSSAVARWRDQLGTPPAKGVPLCEQLEALRDELPYVLARIEARAGAEKIHWGFARARQQRLHAALETLRRLAERDPLGTGP